ncbi:MAG: asparagine synthase (glutamine-hydrolyzing) [Mucilaginibacter sp.]
MCRIAGIISKKLTLSQSHHKVALMCNALRHGGPDDEGFFSNEKANLVFGHRRLSIIDLTNNGHQPMSDIKKQAWITFNGEIYNYLELKQQLLREGALIQSGTDTEVIIQAYLYWGIEAFGKLRGMFAFALFDIEKNITHLVRDTNGIKPLYYHIEKDQLSFASEVKALKIAGIAIEDDRTWPIKLLAFGNIPEPYTTLKNVLCLPKGSYLAWNHNDNSYTINSYKNKRGATCIYNLTEAKEAIVETLNKAIARQLISDAPIGVFLSGGVDSSLITLLASNYKQQFLKTISIHFNEKTYDESSYQNLVFDKLKGEKFTHLVKQHDFDEQFPCIMDAMDLPTTDGINSWFISNYAHQDGLKAVLSGIGADEIFGGYPSFKRIQYLRYLRKLPSALLKLANYFPTDQYRKIAFLSHEHHLADYLLLRGLFVSDDIARIFDINKKQVDDVLFNSVTSLTLGQYDEEHAAWFESNLYMQNQLLRDTDVMSMSHGLEVRVPFLDEDFQYVVECISPEIRFGRNHPKKLLIDSFGDILPPAIKNRAKMGFTFPLQQWMKENNLLSDETAYAGKEAKRLVKKFQKDQIHWSKIFALYQIRHHA